MRRKKRSEEGFSADTSGQPSSHFENIEVCELEARRLADEAREGAESERRERAERWERQREDESRRRAEHSRKLATQPEEVFSQEAAALAREFIEHMCNIAKNPKSPPGSVEMTRSEWQTPEQRQSFWAGVLGIHPGYGNTEKVIPTGIFGYPIGFSNESPRKDIYLCADGLLRQQRDSSAGNLSLDLRSGKSKTPVIGELHTWEEVVGETPILTGDYLESEYDTETKWEVKSRHLLVEELEEHVKRALDDTARRKR